ncbi:MAG: hypothetical protein II393_02580 [Cytophagales bacterium]|nr:hypothetical protein [Cytophagales bacterium]MBQ5475249.1 hypothetical protein [Lachnospiraceae bacterium]MBQ5918320.1 hypothetical protein [Lachnospiraceae bacterium]
MDSSTREFLERLDKRLDTMEADVKDLLAWKNRMMGMFIAISVVCSFLITEIKSRLGII